MRRRAIVGSIAAALLAGGLAWDVLWVRDAIADAPNRPAMLCLQPRDAEAIRAGSFAQERQDRFVATTVNFQKGAERSLRWVLRGVLIERTYVTLWARAQRQEIFRRVVAKARDCPPRRQVPL